MYIYFCETPDQIWCNIGIYFHFKSFAGFVSFCETYIVNSPDWIRSINFREKHNWTSAVSGTSAYKRLITGMGIYTRIYLFISLYIYLQCTHKVFVPILFSCDFSDMRRKTLTQKWMSNHWFGLTYRKRIKHLGMQPDEFHGVAILFWEE